MTADDLRQKFIEFFRGKEHAAIPSASLVPANDPTVLFTTAGMHPLVPFLLGQEHPAGRRLVNFQRCIRTNDIDLVGDDTHLTFFEMLGNWSFGDYFKAQAIEWSWEFLTDRHWLGLDPNRISVTVFAGDSDAPRDDESADMWTTVGVPRERVFFFGKDDNWWGPAGQTGPCGPDTEMFYDTGKPCSAGRGAACNPACGCGRYVEIWNNVFMEYNKTADGDFESLDQRNVDTGMGVERTLQAITGRGSVYETEIFIPLIALIRERASRYRERSARIIADHVKASVFIIADGVQPSNVERGYVLRRLIRRAFRQGRVIELEQRIIIDLADKVISIYEKTYPHLTPQRETIISIITDELAKFSGTLTQGLKIFQKELSLHGQTKFSGKVAFDLYQTYGFPKEMVAEELGPYNISINEEEWQTAESIHRDLSRKGAEKKFAGGLADHGAQEMRLHTATHLLHQALRDVLGDHVFQKGSNITAERLRFDFSHSRKVTAEELRRVEEIVNEKIQVALPVVRNVVSIEKARDLGAIGLFGEKYGDPVSVYSIGDYSKEFCGGPHVVNTNEIGHFKILKEEASSAGVRRIKAIVE